MPKAWHFLETRQTLEKRGCHTSCCPHMKHRGKQQLHNFGINMHASMFMHAKQRTIHACMKKNHGYSCMKHAMHGTCMGHAWVHNTSDMHATFMGHACNIKHACDAIMHATFRHACGMCTVKHRPYNYKPQEWSGMPATPWNNFNLSDFKHRHVCRKIGQGALPIKSSSCHVEKPDHVQV